MGTTISGDTGVVFPDATTQSTAVTVATPFSINASAGAGAQLRLPEATANGVNYVAVKAADALSSNVTWTLPTADGTSGQYLQTNGAGQLSFGSVSPGGTTGQVQINNAGAFGAISSGTSGQVLTSNGAGVAPSFATPTPAAMTLIATRTASSSASLEWTGLSGYNNYLIIFDNLRLSASGAFVGIQFGTGAGPTYVTSNYYNSGMYAFGNVSVTPARNNAVFGLLPQIDSGYDAGDANQGLTGPVHIMSMIDGNLAQMSAIVRYFSSGTTNYNTNVATGFLFANTTVKTAIRVIPNSGTLSSGSVSLYGISS